MKAMGKRKLNGSMTNSRKKQRIERKKEKIKAFLQLVKTEEIENPKTTVSINRTVKQKPKVVQSMTDEELQKLRAELKARQKAAMERPKIYTCMDHVTLPCDVCPVEESKTNEQSSTVNDVMSSLEGSQQLFPVDLQHLIFYAIEGNTTSYKPRWCKLLRQSKVSQVVVLEVPGISKQMYLSSQHCLSAVKDLNFNMCVQMISPHQYGSTFLSEIRDVTFGLMLKEVGQQKNKDFSKLSLLLSPKQMVLEGYPLPVELDQAKDYVFTKDEYSQVKADSPMFAVDCEMCLTGGHQLELTWIAVVNENLETLYESLVKPYNKIINYMTKFSGITEAMLEPVTVRLKDVQTQIRKILPSDAILCGQSLCGDLKAMKMFHPYVIDTSVIYNLSGLRYKKPSLKLLSEKFLSKTIQNDPSGHNPLEDATATMQLVQLKLKQGLSFGDVLSGWSSHSQVTAENDLSNSTAVENNNMETVDKLNETGEICALDSSKHQDECSEPPKKIAKTESYSSSDIIPAENPENCEQNNQDKRGEDGSSIDQAKEKSARKLDRIKNQQQLFFHEVNHKALRSIYSVAERVNRRISIIAHEETVEDCRQNCDSDLVNLVTVTSNKGCYKATKAALSGTDFMIWSQFINDVPTNNEDTLVEEYMSQIDRWVKKVSKKCRPNALLILLFAGDETISSQSNAVCLIKVV